MYRNPIPFLLPVGNLSMMILRMAAELLGYKLARASA